MLPPESEKTPRGPVVLAMLVALFYAAMGYVRYATYTNQTFDLAFYTRMSWGMARFDLWDPILGAHVFGLHLSPVLIPIGAVGAIIGTQAALLLAQGLAAGAAALPLARLGMRALGPHGAYAGALALVMHPNLGHVLAYEAHPGSLAVLPLAWLAYALVSEKPKVFFRAALFVLACREDLALVVVMASLFALRSPSMRRSASLAAGISILWLGLFIGVLHPMWKPTQGSLEAHFGPWGSSVPEVLRTLVTRPSLLVEHLLADARVSYLPRVLASLALLPLLSPRFLLIASPILGVALISFFPTTTRLESHYLTPALPLLVAGAIEGASFVVSRLPRARFPLAFLLLLTSILGTVRNGLFGLDSERPLFLDPPVAPSELDKLVELIPEEASVEAPDALLAHLAERKVVHRSASFLRDDDVIILDLSHRYRFARQESLVRTSEEPRARAMLARVDYELSEVVPPYATFVRDRAGTPARRIDPVRLDERLVSRVQLSACLGLARAHRVDGRLALDFVASGPCPNDLAIRLEGGTSRTRVELLFGGLVSPTHLRAGDIVRSMHDDPAPARDELTLGLIRSSGARPEPSDPIAVTVSLD